MRPLPLSEKIDFIYIYIYIYIYYLFDYLNKKQRKQGLPAHLRVLRETLGLPAWRHDSSSSSSSSSSSGSSGSSGSNSIDSINSNNSNNSSRRHDGEHRLHEPLAGEREGRGCSELYIYIYIYVRLSCTI